MACKKVASFQPYYDQHGRVIPGAGQWFVWDLSNRRIVSYHKTKEAAAEAASQTEMEV